MAGALTLARSLAACGGKSGPTAAETAYESARSAYAAKKHNCDHLQVLMNALPYGSADKSVATAEVQWCLSELANLAKVAIAAKPATPTAPSGPTSAPETFPKGRAPTPAEEDRIRADANGPCAKGEGGFDVACMNARWSGVAWAGILGD
jgi:hypothetical protein